MILFLGEQIGVPQGAPSVHCHVNPFSSLLQDNLGASTIRCMKIEPSSSNQENQAFTNALSKVLSAPRTKSAGLSRKRTETRSSGIPSVKAPSIGGASR